jgi:hypothetical protein
MQCRFCGQQLARPMQAYPAPPGYGAPPVYGAPPPYGAPPGPYGYGAPPPGYGGYGQPYGHPFGMPPPVYRQNGWASGWSTFFWVRLVIVGIAISLSLLGACVSALTH